MIEWEKWSPHHSEENMIEWERWSPHHSEDNMIEWEKLPRHHSEENMFEWESVSGSYTPSYTPSELGHMYITLSCWVGEIELGITSCFWVGG